MLNWFKRHQVILISAVLALVVGGVAVLMRERSDPRLEAIRKQGYPVTLSELESFYKPVPVEQNLALVYARAFDQPAFSKAGVMLQDYDLELSSIDSLTPQAIDELQQFLDENADLLAILHSGSDKTGSRYPVELNQGLNTLLPHLAKLKQAVSLLSAIALLHQKSGHPELAVQSLLAAGRVAESVRDEPVLISYLVRIACWAIITRRLEQVLAHDELSDDQLAELRRAICEVERTDTLARVMAGERALGLSVYDDRGAQQSFFGGGGGGLGTPNPPGANWRASFMIMLLKSTGILQRDRSFYLKMMGGFVEAAEAPLPQRLELERENSSALIPGRFAIFSRMLLPALSRVATKDAEHAARMRTAYTALALEEYRKAHSGEFPDNLGALVPEYAKRIPSDPFTGKPLQYKPKATGFAICSVGLGTNQPQPIVRSPKAAAKTNGICFEVSRTRQQPAANN